MADFLSYLKSVDQALKSGNSTEHTHRPAFKALIESFANDIIATNEPQRIECGSPDFIVSQRATPLGYIEAKDVGVDLIRAEKTAQLGRYRESLRNLVLTDYLDFRLYKNGELVQSASLGKWQSNGVLRRSSAGIAEVEQLLQRFVDSDAPSISSPRDLAERMARLARLMHDLIVAVFKHEGRRGDLHSQYDAFKKVLLDSLTPEQFADMYAQTIAYGLFAARCNHQGSGFTRQHAGHELPKTNPFLRKLFNSIAGADLDDRIAWAVDDLAQLLGRADIDRILKDFGTATRQEDPVVHFYETFLQAYDPKLKEMRGVYYTPEPVVGYIVRSVDLLLQNSFKLRDGLATKTKIKIVPKGGAAKAKAKQSDVHQVQILDPACGTGTFLHGVISHIHNRFASSPGVWPSYVGEHLLPRLYGFELLMAPYAVAHMKLGLQLKESQYDFQAEERLRVFLTNSLEEGNEHAGLPLFTQWLADEAAAASEVKRAAPIMVVIGNPPYSGHSSNKGEWIESLLEEYKKSPQLKKPGQSKWLSDDYVKFIRFSQWRIEQTGYGILGFVTNHKWLDNPTFLDMRSSLMKTFDEVYVLDLHGNSKNNESSPVGADKNVFDIQQGVAISLFVRKSPESVGTATVHHADLWGSRKEKYKWLDDNDVVSTSWTSFEPQRPKNLFVPQSTDFADEYSKGWSLEEIMNGNGDPAPGLLTTHDQFAISFTKDEAEAKVEQLLSTEDEKSARLIWKLCSQPQWKYDVAKKELSSAEWKEQVTQVLYRPFDVRWTVYNKNVAVHRRERVSRHLLTNNNLSFVLPSGVEGGNSWQHVVVCEGLSAHHAASIKEVNYVFPLWLLNSEGTGSSLFGNSTNSRQANFSPLFLDAIMKKLGPIVLSPRDLFCYIYAILYSPQYRRKYREFLRRGFPRIPFPRDESTLRNLSAIGSDLVDLHLLKKKSKMAPRYPVAGDNMVRKAEHKNDRVYINDVQYFDGVPREAWDFLFGSYQVAEKWLKDRKGRLLTFDELQTYLQIIGVVRETIILQDMIDVHLFDETGLAAVV